MKLGKREICIYAGVGVVCILMVWLMGRFIFGFWGGDNSTPEAEVVSVVPDGEAEPIHESKSEAYRSDVGRRNESIDDYFGRLAPEGDEEISLVSDGEEIAGQARNDGRGRDDGERICGVGNSSVRKNEGGKSSGTATERVFGPPPPENSGSDVGKVPRRNGSGAATISSMSPEEKLAYDRQRAEMVRDVLTDSGNSGSSVGTVSDAAAETTAAKEEPLDFSFSSSDGVISSLDDEIAGQARNDGRNGNNGVIRYADEVKRPFRCMFVRDEKIKSGQRVSVRMLEEYNDGDIRIPANTHLQAICKLDSRLHLSIRSLEMNGKIIPLQFEAYDTDGLEGIYCPESSKAAKTATNDLITTAGTSLGGLVGNIANTVIRTGATIARTASGENAVSINSGYEFYLVKIEKR